MLISHRTLWVALGFALSCSGCGSTSGAPAEEHALATGGAAGSGGSLSFGGYGSGGPGPGGLDLGGTGGSSATGGTAGTGGVQQIPVRAIAGLASITFYERTGGTAPNAYTFQVDGPELTTRLPDPLGAGAFDIPGAPTEYYDVYYSDEHGAFDADGSYLTISGVFGQTAPWGGGLNLAEIALNFSGKPTEYGNWVASYVVHGDNADESSVGKCIDGDLQTETTMGNTVDSSDRLRLTLGFESSSGPPPIK